MLEKAENGALYNAAQTSAKTLFFVWRNEIEKIFFDFSNTKTMVCSYTIWRNLSSSDKAINSGIYGTEDGMYHTMGEYSIWFPKTSMAMAEFMINFGKFRYGQSFTSMMVFPNVIDSFFDGKNIVKFKFFANVDKNNEEEYSIAKKNAEVLVEMLSDFSKFEEFEYFEGIEKGDASLNNNANYYVGIKSSYNLWEVMFSI